MVKAVLMQEDKRNRRNNVTANNRKDTRAEPIFSLYEQNKILR
jgi:phage terminase large subunit-like protein